MANTYADTVLEALDVPLVLAIDRGDTLVASMPWRHEKIFGDVMIDRMFETLVNDSTETFRTEHFYKADFLDFPVSKLHAYDSDDRPMFMALSDIYRQDRDGAWPKEALDAYDKHTESMLADYTVQWDRTPRTEAGVKSMFDRLYHRYETYMRLANEGAPVPAEDIWIPVEGRDPASFETVLWSRYPPEMQMIESVCRSPIVYVEKLLAASHAPVSNEPSPNRAASPLFAEDALTIPVSASPSPTRTIGAPHPAVPTQTHVVAAPNAPRKPAARPNVSSRGPKILSGGVTKQAHARGTPWLAASEETTKDERHAMLRALQIPNVAGILSRDAADAITRCIGEVTVEYRHRAKNNVKGERTNANARRANAPVFRYEHSTISKDVVNEVLQRMGKSPNAVDGRVPTRAMCFACFLHIHNVPSEAWPPGNSFPRPVQRS